MFLGRDSKVGKRQRNDSQKFKVCVAARTNAIFFLITNNGVSILRDNRPKDKTHFHVLI